VLLYRRQSDDEKVEKNLLASTEKVLVNPIEPLNKPKELTSYLLIEFERTLMVEPGATQKIYVKYLLEIGVFTGRVQFIPRFPLQIMFMKES